MAFFGLFKLKHLAVTGCTRSLLSNPTFRVGREKRGGPPKNFFDFFFQYLDSWGKKNDRSRRPFRRFFLIPAARAKKLVSPFFE